ncbi:hypothetical protein C8J57DRAFT_375538 [Mycena rebaudengoi]|nr:hypothetical protein C8J57DRAFT_375538 [Mycena rebaudengoi]
MATVHQLPDELLDYILFFIWEENVLWTLCRVSSHFRRLTILPFLSCFNISTSDIQAGTITLSRSFFVILVVAHMNPIRRLVISEMAYDYELLASVLSVAAPIPDILIYHNSYFFRGTIGVPLLLASIPQTACSPLLIVKDDSIIVSSYRAPRPQIHNLPYLHLSNLPSTRKKIKEVVIWGIPGVVLFFIWLILSCWIMITWTYRRIFGPPWDQVFRIGEDLGRLDDSHWIRIQTLPAAAGDFALVTIACQLTEPFRLRHIPCLAPEAYSALLAALELPSHPPVLRVEQQSGLSHPDLLGFLQRHPRTRNLTLDQNSLDPSSFVARWNIPQTVHYLAAPVSYIPKLLPTLADIADIEITFPRSGSETDVAVFDLPAYYEALDAVASLPGTESLWLTLVLPVPATSLPWLNTTDTSMLSGNSRPETRLHRVRCLDLVWRTNLAFSADIVRDLLPWLALFPALMRVWVRLGFVAATEAHQRCELERAISDACPNKDVIVDMPGW